MDTLNVQYRGFAVSVTPVKDCEDLWDAVYRIVPSDGPAGVLPGGAITRSSTLGGHATPEIARRAGLEVAKTEIDNLLALA
jgi:hypothetical protein